MIYLHDGHFDGFLTCIYEHYYTQKVIGIYPQSEYLPTLFDDAIFIKTDNHKAQKVYNALLDQLKEEIYWDIFYTFLSNEPNKDCYLLSYIVVAFKMGRDIYKLHTHEVTYPIKRISKRVMGERHRYLGILRFSDAGHCLYAPFEPENDILMTLSDHFVDRFKNERFIIHDIKRKKAMISNLGEWLITDFELKETLPASERELYFQGLWKSYFESIAIEARENKKLQRQFVPLKVRAHIVEFK